MGSLEKKKIIFCGSGRWGVSLILVSKVGAVYFKIRVAKKKGSTCKVNFLNKNI